MQSLFILITLVYLCIACSMAIRNDVVMIQFFLICVMLQNLILIVFAPYVSNSLISLFSIIKELMLYIALAVSIIRKGKYKGSAMQIFLICFYMVILLLGCVRSPSSLNGIFVSLRFLLLPVVCVEVGKNIKINDSGRRKLYYTIVMFSCVLAVTGILGLTIFRNNQFWKMLNYEYYAVNVKGNVPWSIINSVTINFYTWDFFSIPIRRLISITADPLATSFIVFLGCLIIATGCLKSKRGKKQNRIVLSGFLFVCSLLALSKAVFVLIFISLFLYLLYKNRLPKYLLRLGGAVAIFAVAVVLIRYLATSDQVTSTANHVNGLLEGVKAGGIFGQGVGTAGATAIMKAGIEGTVAESYIGVLAAQIGCLGIFAFIVYFADVLKKLNCMWKAEKDEEVLLALVLLCGLFVCMLFSESAVSIMGTGIYFILIGITLKGKKQEQINR